MSPQHPHTKLLLAAAREVLRPLGLVQMGRSRMWLDDRGWWAGVVSFSPSSFARGSYLNVGVHWLWQDEEDVSFDVIDPRDGEGFVRYESDVQFAPHAHRFALTAAELVRTYRARFDTIESAASFLSENLDLLRFLDVGIALGLLGDADGARAMFGRYIDWFEFEEDLEWREEIDEVRYNRARVLRDHAPDRARFADRIRDDVRRRREHLKLDPDVPVPF